VSDEGRWAKLEEIVRRVVREEIAGLGKKQQIKLVGGKWVGISEEQRASWSEAYGALDLEAELKRAAAWCVSNPHLAPKSQMGRFLNTWFARGQNTASIRSIPSHAERPTVIPKKLCAYCERVSTGTVNGISHCDAHSHDAMDRTPRPFMRGVVAKPVAGAD
jgi:hypothetical protein